jgi:hypothetical protein
MSTAGAAGFGRGLLLVVSKHQCGLVALCEILYGRHLGARRLELRPDRFEALVR